MNRFLFQACELTPTNKIYNHKNIQNLPNSNHFKSLQTPLKLLAHI